VQSGQIDVRTLITGEYPLEEYEKALWAAIERTGVKIFITILFKSRKGGMMGKHKYAIGVDYGA
jgi:hypothetical protein